MNSLVNVIWGSSLLQSIKFFQVGILIVLYSWRRLSLCRTCFIFIRVIVVIGEDWRALGWGCCLLLRAFLLPVIALSHCDLIKFSLNFCSYIGIIFIILLLCLMILSTIVISRQWLWRGRFTVCKCSFGFDLATNRWILKLIQRRQVIFEGFIVSITCILHLWNYVLADFNFGPFELQCLGIDLIENSLHWVWVFLIVHKALEFFGSHLEIKGIAN